MSLKGVDRVVAESDIRDCLARYCRGIDRMDRDLLDSAYWADAYDDHDAWKGNAGAFIDWVLEALTHFDQSVHMLGQSLFEFPSADRASVETYLFNYLRQKVSGGANDILLCGRYLDVFERRDAEWRILHRRVATDWVRDLGTAPSWDEEIVGHIWKMGARKPVAFDVRRSRWAFDSLLAAAVRGRGQDTKDVHSTWSITTSFLALVRSIATLIS